MKKRNKNEKRSEKNIFDDGNAIFMYSFLKYFIKFYFFLNDLSLNALTL